MSIENKLLACLKTAGLDPKMDSFSDRKKMQKIVHLMQYAGIDFPFNFSWYFRGPYSSTLTDSLYKIVRTNTLDVEKLSEEEQLKIQKIKDFLGDRIQSADYLELFVSILYLRRKSSEVDGSDQDVIRIIRENKPYFSEIEVNNCLKDVAKFDEAFGI